MHGKSLRFQQYILLVSNKHSTDAVHWGCEKIISRIDIWMYKLCVENDIFNFITENWTKNCILRDIM